MRRPRRRLEVSTFPFLAVLLCAMGSLILLLLILDRRAKAAARARAQEIVRVALAERGAAERAIAEAAARRAEERAAERERRRTELHDQLARASDEVTAQLKSVEGRKSEAARGVAAQAQRWRELLEVLGSRREELAKAERETATKRAATTEAGEMSESARKEAARLSAQLRGLEVVLDELKAARKRDAQTYSLMPYRSKRGDGRRPLYIECSSEGLIFHPDRKTLSRIATAQEVRNEVDARVERQRQAVLAQGGQPEKRAYLLMLVRPNGIANYYATLGTLKGKEIDFGYEFIDADWVLDFPEGDAAPTPQPWMTAPRIAVAPADPSAPTRKVAGLRAGRIGGVDDFGEGDATGSGPAHGSSDLPPLPSTRTGPGSLGGGPGQAGGSGSGGVAWTPVVSGMGGAGRGSDLPPLPGVSFGGGAPGPYDPRAPPGGTGGSGSGGSSAVALMPGGSRPGSGLSPQSGGTGVPGAVPLVGGASRGNGVPNPDGTMPGNSPPTPGGGSGTGQAGGTPGVAGTAGGTSGIPGSAGGTPGVPGSAGWTKQVPGTGGNGGGSGPPVLFPFDRATQPRNGSGGSAGGGAGGGQGTGSPGNGQPGSANGSGRPATGGATGQTGGTPGSGQLGGTGNSGGSQSGGAAAGGQSGGGQGTGSPGNGQPVAANSGGQPATGGAPGQTGGTPGSGQSGGTGSADGGESGGAAAGGQSGGSPTDGSTGEAGGAPAKGARSGGVADEAPGAGPSRGGGSGGPPSLGGGGGGPPAPAGGARGGLPSDPDSPQGPNLGAGLLPGGERRSNPPPARPMRLIGNRDWVIPIECRADSVVLRNAGQKFAPPNAAGDNPVLQSLRQTIARRQASVRPGEPPYRPQVRFLIYPDGLKTYYLTLSALEPLGIPLTRQNVEADPSPRPAP